MSKKNKKSNNVMYKNQFENYMKLDNQNSEFSSYNKRYIKPQDQIEFEKASYDFSVNSKNGHIIDKILQTESTQYNTSLDELNRLAQGTQNDVNKIIKINSLIQYYANKDDLVNIVLKSIRRNTNVKYDINYPEDLDLTKKKNIKIKEQIENILDKFFDNISIKEQIRKESVNTYTDGTYITYLRNNKNKVFNIITYPLGLVQVSDFTLDGEPLCYIDMDKLKSMLNKTRSKYRNIKSDFIKIPENIEEEIKNNYPPEVYKAYKDNCKMAFLDPKRTGVHRTNSKDGLYGVSSIFTALPSLLMLDTIDKTDRNLILMKSKAIFYQKLRKELMGKEYTKTKNFAELKFAQDEFTKAMAMDTVIYSSPAYVEDVSVVQATTELTEPETKTSYRNKIMNSLGISFLANDSSTSFNSVDIAFRELLREINMIVEQFETTLNKYIKVVCLENDIPINFIPTIKIDKTEHLDQETLLKLIDVLYSKLGVSYETVFNMLGMDYNTEKSRREKENKEKADEEIFIPHGNSYTSNSNDLLKNKNSKTEENQNNDKNKQVKDKNRYDKKV